MDFLGYWGMEGSTKKSGVDILRPQRGRFGAFGVLHLRAFTHLYETGAVSCAMALKSPQHKSNRWLQGDSRSDPCPVTPFANLQKVERGRAGHAAC